MSQKFSFTFLPVVLTVCVYVFVGMCVFVFRHVLGQSMRQHQKGTTFKSDIKLYPYQAKNHPTSG